MKNRETQAPLHLRVLAAVEKAKANNLAMAVKGDVVIDGQVFMRADEFTADNRALDEIARLAPLLA